MKQSNNSRTIRIIIPTSVSSTRPEEKITKINFGEDNTSERVVQTERDISVQRMDKQTGNWITVYKKTKISTIGSTDYRITSGYLNAAKQHVVVLSCSRGSGGYLTYTILSKKNGKIVELVNKEDVYRGDIFFENGRLLEKRDSRYSEWVLKNGRLSLIPYTIPKIPGALRIEYAILPDGRVKIEKNHFTAPVGTIVQTIRTDFNEIRELGFIDGTKDHSTIIKYLDNYKQAFKIVERGTVEVKIVPDLDWSKAFTFTIEAK